MTEKQKIAADKKMNALWKEFVYEETMRGSKQDYTHLDEIIRAGMFIKKYVQCEKNIGVYWIFIFCDGEFGVFDGYKYTNEIPVSLAQLVNLEMNLETDVIIKNGNYIINPNIVISKLF